jgi:hypothetical protein
MAQDMQQRYTERLNRYVTALRNGRPDCVPIRPFVAEFIAKYAGFTCQQVTHDFEYAFEATRKCAADFDWDATVANMVYVWTGLTEAIGLRYYGVPGITVDPNTGFQYLEPPEGEAFMREDEYDALIDDPTAFLFNTWLPRVSKEVCAIGEPASYRNNLSFLKGGMAMLSYFSAFPAQIDRMRTESGTVSAIAGIFKAPLDILADKLRGYIGLSMDLIHQPEKVLAACEALMPHLLHAGLGGADPDKHVPIGFWMHRGCVPFISHDQFNRFYWPTLKPIIEEFWRHGHQTLFYAEGDWNHHLESFAELPDQSMVFHVDRSDIFEAHRVLGHKFCLSGGVPNYLLAYGTSDEVRAYCKKIIDNVAGDGGYIMDASAIIQNDATVENVRAMTDFTREYGVYSGATPSGVSELPEPELIGMGGRPAPRVAPGACIPWDDKARGLPDLTGDPDLVRRVWEANDALGNLYIWHCLLSF